jgi:hypothetical protein
VWMLQATVLLAFAGAASAQKHSQGVPGGPVFPNLNPGLSSKGPGWSPPGLVGKDVPGIGSSGPGKGPSDKGPAIPSFPPSVDRGNPDKGPGSPADRGNSGVGSGHVVDRGPAGSPGGGNPDRGNPDKGPSHSGGNGSGKGNSGKSGDKGNSDKGSDSPGENIQASAETIADPASKSRPLHAIPTCQ